MRRIAKFSLRIAILAMVAFLGYALFADLPAPVREIRVTLRGPVAGAEAVATPDPIPAPAPAPVDPAPAPAGAGQAPAE